MITLEIITCILPAPVVHILLADSFYSRCLYPKSVFVFCISAYAGFQSLILYLLAKSSMLCYSFVQFIESTFWWCKRWRWITQYLHSNICLAPDVAAGQRAVMDVDVCMSTRVDVRNVNATRSWRLVQWCHQVQI